MDIATVLFWVIYLLLGAHSLYFHIKRVRLYQDIDLELIQIFVLITAFLVPIISHLVTHTLYPDSSKKPKILFKKRKK
jgi:antibiotic biosynthesis monooxygenase (ABM) superfamily enzyme